MTYEQERELELQKKVIPQTMKPDFAQFWQEQVAQLRQVPIKITREKLDMPYEKSFITYEITYNTHDDTVIHAYFSCPVGAKGKLPCVVYYHGGRGRRSLQADIVATGVCCFAMDVRGQSGLSIDRADYRSGCTNGGLMTCGILEKENFYMRNIYLDAVRAMDVVAQLEEVDPERIVTYGGSQGGALSIAASALSGRSKKCYTQITSYCCLKNRVELGSGILNSTNDYIKRYPQNATTVFDVLSYFDIINMVSLLKVPTDFCMGLSDPICLPHFVYSAYAHANCEKKLYMYPFVLHEVPFAYKLVAQGEFAQL